jgi:tetratricopeptide (TPR) repeat protein
MKNKSKFRSGRGAKRFGHQQQTPLQNVSLLKRAVALHQNGEMAEAESLYLQILKAAPNHFDGWHLLGVLRHQQGRHTEALGLIGAALKTNPNVPQALSN